MSSPGDEEALAGLYVQRQDILRQLADLDTNIKLLESQNQEKCLAASRLVTEELTTGGNTEVDKVKQLIYRCMRDASGLKDALRVTEACRHIMENLNPSDAANDPRLHFRNVFVHETIAHARELSQDANGSDFMQRVISLMKNGTVPARLRELDYDVNPSSAEHSSPVSEVMLLIEQLGDDLVPVICNTSGARVAQKIVDSLSTIEEFAMLSSQLSSASYIELSKDINGNHSLSKLISSSRLLQLNLEAQGNTDSLEAISSIYNLIYTPIVDNCIDICKNRQGCCIIQKCLQSAPDPYYTVLINTVLSNSLKLVQDPFGNYVVQFILDCHNDFGVRLGVHSEDFTPPNYTNQIIRQILHHVAELSCNKFSSNVIEKCLKTASTDVRQLLVDELTDPQVLPKLLTDSFANYVIQTAIVTASDDGQFAQLRDSIMPLQSLLKNSPYGVKIETRLSRRHREATRKQAKKKEAAAAAAAAAASSLAVPPQQGLSHASSQETFMVPPPTILPSVSQGVPTFMSTDGTTLGTAPMAFTNLPHDLIFSQQQMLGSMPFMFQGHQQMIGIPNTQHQFTNMNMNPNMNLNPNMNMNMNMNMHMNMNINGNGNGNGMVAPTYQ